jgi:radical SAM protein with 4Fe4S-binding SPASM domain
MQASVPLYRPADLKVYPVDGAFGTRPYLLFSSSLHYWVAVSDAAARLVVDLADGESAAGAAARTGRDTESVRSFLETLVATGLLSTEPIADHASWVPPDFTLDRPETYPFQDIILSLGDRCNLACSYCFNADNRRARLSKGSAGPQMGRADIARMAREYAALGGRSAILTGGEPTLNPELVEICGDVKAAGLEVKLITNGTRLARFDPAALAAVVDLIAVSLDSADDAVNAELWQVSRYKVEPILAALAAIGQQRRADGTQVQISLKPTVTARNIGSLPELILEASRALEGCRLLLDIGAYSPIGDPEVDAALSLEPGALEAALERAGEALLDADAVDAADRGRVVAQFAASLGGKARSPARPSILSCAPSFFVANDGAIYPCQALETEDFRMGTAQTGGLAEAFAAPRFAELRQSMTRDSIEVCRSCELRYVCTEHCHGDALEAHGRTTAFLKPDTTACRSRVVRRMWLEAQGA